jgi:hypothetical protein
LKLSRENLLESDPDIPEDGKNPEQPVMSRKQPKKSEDQDAQRQLNQLVLQAKVNFSAHVTT